MKRRGGSWCRELPSSSPVFAKCCGSPRTAKSRRWHPPKHAAGSSTKRRCCATHRPPRGGSTCRCFRLSICSSCSPLFDRHGSAYRRRAASPRRSGSICRAARPKSALRSLPRRAPCSRNLAGRPITKRVQWRRRCIAAAGCGPRPSSPRCLPAMRMRQIGRRGYVCGRGSPNGASLRPGRRPVTRRCGPRRRAHASPSCSVKPPSRVQSKPITPRRRLPRSRRALSPTCRKPSSPKPGQGSARRSAISRRRACGRRRTTGRYGSRPTPATCRPRSPASSTGSTPIPS